MTRAILLSKIHALNWYGYRDTLPVKGNLVLAGVTGSGKSILMDLLMLVLVGPEKARNHFNRSATGSRSDRTIKGYCLLDTKREENGQPQYFHDKGVTTYIAAEFTWPDGSRDVVWWTTRCERALGRTSQWNTDAGLLHVAYGASGKPKGALALDATYLEPFTSQRRENPESFAVEL